MKLAKLSATSIEAFLGEKADIGRLDGKGGLGPTSIRRLTVTLTKSLGAAVRKGLLASNPMDRVERSRTPQEDVTETVWKPEETTIFLDAIHGDRLYPLWHTVAMTGLRRKELCGLQWADLDLTAATLSAKRARVQVNGAAPITKGPKSPASRRVVDFDTGTRDVLRAWKVAQLEEKLPRRDSMGRWRVGVHQRDRRAGISGVRGQAIRQADRRPRPLQDHHAPASSQPLHRAPRRRDAPEGGAGAVRALLD